MADEYVVVTGTSADELAAKVRELMDQNWAPLGGVAVGSVPEGRRMGILFAQALTRPDTPKDTLEMTVDTAVIEPLLQQVEAEMAPIGETNGGKKERERKR